MNDKLSFCLEITNWCNLKCAHCCNMSGPTEPKHFIPLADVKKLITQFTEIESPKTGYACIAGGEPMLAYDFGEKGYIPRTLSMLFDAGQFPTIKTNATWGKHAEKRKPILKSLAQVAQKYQKWISVEISLDEFHKNTPEVANIISDVTKSDELRPAICIFLSGFNTEASLKKLTELQEELTRRGIEVLKKDPTKYAFDLLYSDIFNASASFDNQLYLYDFGVSYQGKDKKIFSAFDDNIFCDGRAAITGVATTGPSTGKTCAAGNFFIVKNTDTAVLNSKFHEKIAGRDLNTVFQSLMAQLHAQER